MTIAPGLLPEGLRDRLPPQAEASSHLLHRVIVAIGRHGYARVSPPLAEFEEGLVGQLKSAGSRDLFRFVDPVSQRTLALRPDITAQVGRIAATRMGHRPRPLRLAYGGPVLKLKATQLRPERELTQTGAELIGTDSVAAVIEILQVAIEALEVAGVTGITVDLTLPDLVETLAAGAMPLPAGKIDAARDMLDAKDAGGLAGLGASAYLPFIEAAGPVAPALAKLRAIEGAQALDKRLEAIEAIVVAIGDRVSLTLDPTERHGFEYQRWIGFSLFGEGLSGEIGRGGTYSIVHPDGSEEKATGFSLYLDPLVDVGLGAVEHKRVFLPLGTDPATSAKLRAEDWITIAAVSEADDAAALGCTHILRDGHPVAL
ncbi:ATP phosphoribosyltransferase regulatory subunit [Rhizorhabdus dicambivorans]|uniref:Histidine--tRNA ligase n=1 Tax=Rhizorhabdus dicambivorans TaxID=1850238 RepID=A0A2A4FZ71_9SPHN|nr:ATP phosphoribosyltransferase regulatory subunit [Rhizorhabdus dicambivorans]ATE65908.1 ATP phosphoribosyltransferase regulatory subunit [Rhizorhabdus dicambivorans]PCE43022.1 ATP phosphoribosyltransferase regulatory subunit [Rhizorhabdus dicambivorans]